MGNFGERLARLRLESGLTQTALAQQVEVSQSAISQMESGERRPSFDMLQSLADALGVAPSRLLGEELDEEKIYFRQYRSLPEDARAELREFAEELKRKHSGD